ncbi:hypothetical protein AAC387_Pa12g1754 [Persea americana]
MAPCTKPWLISVHPQDEFSARLGCWHFLKWDERLVIPRVFTVDFGAGYSLPGLLQLSLGVVGSDFVSMFWFTVASSLTCGLVVSAVAHFP